MTSIVEERRLHRSNRMLATFLTVVVVLHVLVTLPFESMRLSLRDFSESQRLMGAHDARKQTASDSHSGAYRSGFEIGTDAEATAGNASEESTFVPETVAVENDISALNSEAAAAVGAGSYEYDQPPTGRSSENDDDTRAKFSQLTDIGFDLADTESFGSVSEKPSGGTINVRKPLYAGSERLGTLSITIDKNARLYVSTSALANLLEERPRLRSLVSGSTTQKSTSFRRLRDMGIDLRYEPVEDRIILQSG